MSAVTNRVLPWISGLIWALSMLAGRADIEIWEIANVTTFTVAGGGGGKTFSTKNERLQLVQADRK